MKITVRIIAIVIIVCAALVGYIVYAEHATETAIAGYAAQVQHTAQKNLPPVMNNDAISALPEPVQRYFRFTFPESPRMFTWVEIHQEGQFRRPQRDDFHPTTAEQTIALGTPALVFSATTPIGYGTWARAYDFFSDGHMEMKAKILSAMTVMEASQTPELDKISLRRWLLESPLYPMALLPGGPVRWEAIDERRARAIVSAFGIQASLVATFRPDGSLEDFTAEESGDLTTPYHGSGEYAMRSDYRLIEGMMLPMRFSIARMSEGKKLPFWEGTISKIRFLSKNEPLQTGN